MGDMADAILNGDFDEETGEYIGPGDGYPRSHQREERENKKVFSVSEIEMAKTVTRVQLGIIQRQLFDAGYSFISIKEIQGGGYYLKTESGTVINIYLSGKMNLQGKVDQKISVLLGLAT